MKVLALFSAFIVLSSISLGSSQSTENSTGYLLGNWTWNVDNCSLNVQILANDTTTVLQVDNDSLACLNDSRLYNYVPIILPFAWNSTLEDLQDQSQTWMANGNGIDLYIYSVQNSTLSMNIYLISYGEYHDGALTRSNGSNPTLPAYFAGNWTWNVDNCALDVTIFTNGTNALLTVDAQSILCLSTLR